MFRVFFLQQPHSHYFEWLEERELASLVPMVVGIYEEAGIHMYRKWCGLRTRYMLISHEKMQVMNVELYPTSMPFFSFVIFAGLSHFLPLFRFIVISTVLKYVLYPSRSTTILLCLVHIKLVWFVCFGIWLSLTFDRKNSSWFDRVLL